MFSENGPLKTFGLLLAGGALCIALVWGGFEWTQAKSPTLSHPFVELLKLVCAALVGWMVTAVHKRYHGEKPLARSLEHAQILLCVAGALVMIIVSNNIARAFGLAGAAGVIRFRTPVEDPKDTTVIFLLLTLGLASGLGAFAVVGLGTAFLCLFLMVLSRSGESRRRAIMLSVVATGREFPSEHVGNILAGAADSYEPREVVHGNEAVVRYYVTLDPNTSLSWLSQQLMNGGHLKSVSWGEPTKKGG